MGIYRYKEIFCPTCSRARKSGWVSEHIAIAEQKIGRTLHKEEVIHHVDGNKANNNPDNLIVFKDVGNHSCFHITRSANCNRRIWNLHIEY